jgi:hypothetical protein
MRRVVTRIGGTWRELRPGRNPLRRACDRAEAALLAGLVAAFLIGVPLAGIWAYRTGVRAGHAEQASWHQVPAVLLEAAPAGGYAGNQAAVPARWAAPGGAARTGRIIAPAGAPVGSTVALWVDASGRPVGLPLGDGQMAGQAVVASVAAVAVVGFLLLCASALGRWALARRRLAAWDAAWRVVGPQWSSQI